jgi:hypothetical protein
LPEWASVWADCDPRIVANKDVFDFNCQYVTWFCSFDVNGAADGIGQRGMFVESWPVFWDCLVIGRLEESGACIPSLDFYQLPTVNLE